MRCSVHSSMLKRNYTYQVQISAIVVDKNLNSLGMNVIVFNYGDKFVK